MKRSLLGAGSLGGVARVQRLFGGAVVDVYVLIGPGGDVAQRRGTAVGESGHLGGLQHPVPQVELGQLPNQSLGGVETPAQRVLGWKNKRL